MEDLYLLIMLETTEGLDTLISLFYYSRGRFVIQLLPLLLASSLPGHFVSVLNPKFEGRLVMDDLSLREPKNYGFTTAGSHVAHMTISIMEELATRHPGKIASSFIYPGLVMTDGADKGRLPAWVRLTWKYLAAPVLKPFAVPSKDCGERVLFLASPKFPARSANQKAQEPAEEIEIAVSSDGIIGGGAYQVNWDGETLPQSDAYKKVRVEYPDLTERIWTHTMEAYDVIASGKVFDG
jgi:hypothetical protein